MSSSVRAAVAATVNGAPDKALSVSTTPGMTDDDVILSGPASGTFYLEIPISFDLGGPAALWRIPLRHARVTMTVVAGSYASGTISGIAATEELVAELEKVAGRIGTQLCGGSTLDTMRQTIRQASDILVDGTQDPTKDCNGVSFGIGFSAKQVTASGVAPAPAAGPDLCNP